MSSLLLTNSFFYFATDMGEMSDDARRRKGVLRRLFIATALCSFFLVVEVVGGLLAGSLAILSDAAHLFADLASFAVASK